LCTSSSNSEKETARREPQPLDEGDAPSPSRPILAIDLGLARTGFARSDPGRTVAFGLPTFHDAHGRSLKEHIRTLNREEPLGGVVLGLPLHMDGRPGDLASRVRRLGEWIREELAIPVAYLDERLSSVEAEQMLRDAKRSVRREKGARDRLAAQILLREFLQAGCPFLDPPEAA
jgi:putative holliday junction resolvase